MILIFGHKNPDTDSIVSAYCLDHLKRKLGFDTKACRLGDLNKESDFVFKKLGLNPPEKIDDVKTQISDVEYRKTRAMGPRSSIYNLSSLLAQEKVRSLAIVDEEGLLQGVVSMEDIVINVLDGDIYKLHTDLDRLVEVLQADILTVHKNDFVGKVSVASYYEKNEKLLNMMDKDRILIVGDRYDVIEKAIERKVQLIILTGKPEIPTKLIEMAEENRLTMISSKLDTYTCANKIFQANHLSTIMTSKNLKYFVDSQTIENVLDEFKKSNFSNYPIVDKDYKYMGLISRKDLLFGEGKKVILVDHNEKSQTAEGIDEATILEVYDHHRIGNIDTRNPIFFRNMPIGSTSTIIFNLYKENMVKPDKEIGILLMSGIISDTLNLTSPTTTKIDKIALEELEILTGLSSKEYALEMFKAGTAVGDTSIDELFHKDYKVFEVSSKKIGIGQIYTLDIESIMKRKDEIENLLDKKFKESGQFLTMLVVTDIYAKGSYFFYKSEAERVLSLAFEKDLQQGSLVSGVVSRKKQIVPKLMNAIMNM